MTKVTYYMYSCDTCYKIRVMMEMDGLDRVKCQKSKSKDTLGIMELLMIMRQKMNSVHLLKKDQKMCIELKGMQ